MPRLTLASLLCLSACVRSSPAPAPVESPAETPAAQTVDEPKPQRELAPVPAVEQPFQLAPLSRFTGTPIASETRDGGLEIYDYAAGDGIAAELGDFVEVHYILTLDDGREVDSSHARDKGFVLVLGETSAIPGFTAGLIGARVGMLRKFVVPPELGYGDRELPGIPPRSRLIFHVQVIAVSDW